MEFLDRLKTWLQRDVSRVLGESPGLLASCMDHLTLRVEIILAGLAFIGVGMLRPKSAWVGMKKAIEKTL
jgi:hypothetical protein